jgi:hypothetical protein
VPGFLCLWSWSKPLNAHTCHRDKPGLGWVLGLDPSHRDTSSSLWLVCGPSHISHWVLSLPCTPRVCSHSVQRANNNLWWRLDDRCALMRVWVKVSAFTLPLQPWSLFVQLAGGLTPAPTSNDSQQGVHFTSGTVIAPFRLSATAQQSQRFALPIQIQLVHTHRVCSALMLNRCPFA